MTRVYYYPNGNSTTPQKSKPKGRKVSCSLQSLIIGLFAVIVLFLVSIFVTYLTTLTLARRHVTPAVESFDNETHIPIPEEIIESEEPEHIGPTPEELRLPKTIEPIWYNLTIRVYLPGFVEFNNPEKNLTFSAALMMKILVKEKTNRIELNSKGLNLPTDVNKYSILIEGASPKSAPESEESSAVLEQPSKVTKKPAKQLSNSNVVVRQRRTINRFHAGISVTKITVNETLEKVIFDLDGDLEKDKEYILQFRYTGPILRKLAGLYLTTYKDPEDKVHYAAVTQMAPTDARRFVPCFDEPEFRAVWKIRIFHPKGSKAISNAMEIVEDQVDERIPGFLWTSFEETPKMSSYLLAIVVSDFEYIEGHTKRGIRFRIWSRKEAINETEYALQTGIKILEFYENYFGIQFPLQKQDMVAIPDFGYGAMENWGLVTYREMSLLYNPTVYSLLDKQYVTTVVVHELAHQWFGNLVTMKWWNDVWLNEGFATLMEYIGTDVVDPSFKMEDWLIKRYLSSAFKKDAMATSHPLSFPIEKAEDVSASFDTITYDKGASVLHMLRNILGKEDFEKGLNIYLNRYAYSNAEHVDLWNTLTKAVSDSLTDWSGNKFDVDDFAKKWTEQMGYPVVSVTTTKKGVKLAQKRFKLDESSEESPKFKNPKYWYKWDIPIWYTINGSSQPLSWLHSEEEIKLPNPDSLVLVNPESTGFYRVKYDQEQMNKINKQFLDDHTAIKMRSRARYIDDAFTLARAGHIPYEQVLDMTRYLSKEKDYLPIAMAMIGFWDITGYFGDEPESEYLRAYLRQIFDERYESIKEKVFKEGEAKDFYQNQMNTLIIRTACNLRNQDCIDRILESYHEEFVIPCQENSTVMPSQCSRVPVSLRNTAYCLGIEYGVEKDWNKMFHLFQKESVQVERDRLLNALSCSRDTFTLKKLLKMATDINNTVFRLQDRSAVFTLVSQSYIGDAIIFEFFANNWSEIYHNLKDQYVLLEGFVRASLGGKNSKRVKEIEDFLADNKATTRNLDLFKERLEIVRTNANWMERNYEKLVAWFKKASDNAKLIN